MTKTVRVKVEGRLFLAKLNDAGDVVIIYERKLYAPGKLWAAWYNAPYWHAGCHKPGGPKTIVGRIKAATQRAPTA